MVAGLGVTDMTTASAIPVPDGWHISLNIGGKPHAAKGFGWRTSRGSWQPAIIIAALPLTTAEARQRTYTPGPLALLRFETEDDAASRANGYLDRAAAQVVADWSNVVGTPIIVSPDDWTGLGDWLTEEQWAALAEVAGDDSRSQWWALPSDKQDRMVEMTSEYLQANATDISGLIGGSDAEAE